MGKINIVSATDDLYAQHLGVMFTSLLENTSSPRDIDIYIIDGGIQSRNKELLSSTVTRYGCNLRFLSVQPELYEQLVVRSYFGQATYFRLFIPGLMDPAIEKVIYLDCDLIVRGDIARLWEVDISQYYVAAVEDAGNFYNGAVGLEQKTNLGVPREVTYFNAGVLLINLEKWRESGISKQIVDFIKNNPEIILFCDQDGLNAILHHRWLPLPYAWNVQTTYFEQLEKNQVARDSLRQAIQNPMIIHYTNSSKPWNYPDTHPLKKEYYRYLKLTPWKDFVPADRNLKNLLAKAINGKLTGHYLDTVKMYYRFDRTLVPENLGRRFWFKLLYLILFPFGNGYLKIFRRLTKISYYMENRNLSHGLFRSRVLSKIIYIIVFPARYLLPKPYHEKILQESLNRKPCPCCGYQTLQEETQGEPATCPICYWKDDLVQYQDPDDKDGVNIVSLRQARRNFLEFGASEERFIKYVRKPEYIDEKAESWRPVEESFNRLGC